VNGIIIMISFLLVVLYCEKKHGTGKELQDFSNQVLIEPPAWAKQGVLYQVFPRVFTNEGTFKALEVIGSRYSLVNAHSSHW